MNRRQFLAGASTAVAGTAAGYGGVRVADIRPYDPPLPTGDSPRERIIAAAKHRSAADHRATTRTRVLDDGTGDAPYDLDAYRRRYQHSRRRYLHALTTYRGPLRDAGIDGFHQEMLPHPDLWAALHYGRVFRNPETLPSTTVTYVTDGRVVHDTDAPAPAGSTVRVSDARADVIAPNDYPTELAPVAFVRPHRTDWKTSEESAETVTYRVSGPDAYAQVVPFRHGTRDVELGDCRIEVTLDRDTGRLRQITDHRVLTLDREDGSERSLTYRIETDFDRYEETAVRPPVGDIEQDFSTRLRGFLFDLLTY
ncbi:hypothetical protein C464_12725 [Halorubrum coriense DSM 10284]|uniref:Uncharacterized protein n=1 Tax=Halorubrum coriense DSM 10284 TaxID=1227466 RepID=M0EC12_9EURY|nr:hypothetical protein [Halorubrum coriense]ELZ45351.1 hypothetical protein C464_12725 [Halorubrum coriense DSM 10284]